MSANTHLRRPMPEDFAAMYPVFGNIKLASVHYRAHNSTVARWMDEAGIPRGVYAPNRLPVPDDFGTVARRLIKADLARHYGVHIETINRWLRVSGAEAKVHVPVPPVHRRAPGHTNIAQTKAYGADDTAADVLRRFYPVYRCDERGKADFKGKFWRAGNSVMTGADLIARAARKAA